MIDIVANSAFYFGLVRALAELDPPLPRQMSFQAASDNFFRAAREGIEAELFWPGVGEVPASELILRTLLPLAYEGLDAWGVDRRDRDHYLGVIEQRALKRLTGASWQVKTFRHLLEDAKSREAAITEMTARYLEGMRSNEPVHTWPLP